MAGASNPLGLALGGPEFSQAVTILLTGSSRLAVNHAAYEFCRRINPGYFWLEVRAPDAPVSWREPSAQGLIPEKQLLTTSRPQELAPEDTEVDIALWKVIRPGDALSDVGHFANFMRLPSMIQALFPDITSTFDHRPAVFSLVNGDRIAEFYPVDLESTRALLEVFKQEHITFLFAALDSHRPDRLAFDYVFRIPAEPAADEPWSGALCEKAPPGSALRKGSYYDVRDG